METNSPTFKESISHFLHESEFWITLLMWMVIAGTCVVVSNVVAATA